MTDGQATAREANPATDRTVLIVEDDLWLGGILVRSLERLGLRADLAATLAEARNALAGMTPDILLLDVDLPDGAGWELLRERQAPVAGAVIVMSAGQPARRRLAEFQPYCFLGKPFALDALLTIIDQAGAAAPAPTAALTGESIGDEQSEERDDG